MRFNFSRGFVGVVNRSAALSLKGVGANDVAKVSGCENIR